MGAMLQVVNAKVAAEEASTRAAAAADTVAALKAEVAERDREMLAAASELEAAMALLEREGAGAEVDLLSVEMDESRLILAFGVAEAKHLDAYSNQAFRQLSLRALKEQ